MTSGRRWYVVHTQPNREARAETNLRQQGYETYLPRYARVRRHARKTETVSRPLFPRYLFVALDLARDGWRSIRSTFGVSDVVLAGDGPAPLPDEVVAAIREREDQSGLVRLGLPAGVGPGTTVRIIDGVFAEARGVVERVADEYRVSVLLRLLGREVRVLVPGANVSAA